MSIDQTNRWMLGFFFGTVFCFVPIVLSAENSNMSHVKPVENLVIGYQNGGSLPFVVEVSQESEVYQWSTLAILIVGIECDGKDLPPFGRGISINSFDSSMVPVSSSQITYLASASTLVSVLKYHEGTGEYFAVGYMIPPKFNQIVITYRCRFPNGESERLYKLRITPELSP